MPTGDYDPLDLETDTGGLGAAPVTQIQASFTGAPALTIEGRRTFYKDNALNGVILDGFRFSSFNTDYVDPSTGLPVDVTDVATGVDGAGQPTLVKVMFEVGGGVSASRIWPLPNLKSSPAPDGVSGGTYHFQPGTVEIDDLLESTWLSVPDKMYGSGDSLVNPHGTSPEISSQDFESLEKGSSGA